MWPAHPWAHQQLTSENGNFVDLECRAAKVGCLAGYIKAAPWDTCEWKTYINNITWFVPLHF